MNGFPVEDDEPAWRKLKLTLERPHRDDQGNVNRQLLDVTPEGQQIYEPYAYVSYFLFNDRLFIRFPVPRIPTDGLRRTSAECSPSEATISSRRGTLRVGESMSGTPPVSMANTKEAAPNQRICPLSL